MIISVGTDIVKIERIEKAKADDSLDWFFTPNELKLFADSDYSSSVIAANFAVKESVVKAFGTGFVGIMPKDVEVLRNKHGVPYVNFHAGAKIRAAALGVEMVHVSLAHEKEYVIAFVVLEGDMIKY